MEAQRGHASREASTGRTSMSRRKNTRHWKRRARCWGSLRIMPGAFSRASHSVDQKLRR